MELLGKKGYKTCPKCLTSCGVRSYKCTNCDHVFKERVEKEHEIQIYHKGGRGRKFCEGCKQYIGVKIKVCSCGKQFTFEEPKPIVNEVWPDIWLERSQRFAEKFGFHGTAIYALGHYHGKKPNLNEEDIRDWAEDLIYSFYYESGQSKFLTRYALNSLLRTFYEGNELKLCFRYLDKWENSFET